MQARMWSLAAGVMVGTCVAAPAALAQPGDESAHATARLVSEHAALTPGQTNYLGLTFEIEPGWHIYSNSTNDTGFPIRLELKAPEGYTVGEIQWPAPERYVSPGDLLDHVYEDRVTLIVPVEVPADAQGEATFTGTSEWLVCKEACLPGAADLKLSLPVGGDGAGKPSESAKLLAAARERIPKPLPEENPPFTYNLTGDAYELIARDAKFIAFYPAEDCVKLENPIRDAQSDKGKLRLMLGDLSPGPRLKGTVELRADPKAKGRFYAIDLPIADTATPLRMPPAGR